MFKRKKKTECFHIVIVDLSLCKGYDFGITCETEAQAEAVSAMYNANNNDCTIEYSYYKGVR